MSADPTSDGAAGEPSAGAGVGAGAGAGTDTAVDAGAGSAETPTQTPQEPRNLFEAGALVLRSSDPAAKADLTLKYAKLFLDDDALPLLDDGGDDHLPLVGPAALPDGVEMVGEDAINHFLRTAERDRLERYVHSTCLLLNAAWEIICHFGRPTENAEGKTSLKFTPDIYRGWVVIARSHATHFKGWNEAFAAVGGRYGFHKLPNTLVKAMEATRGDLCERLALVHCFYETHYHIDQFVGNKREMGRAGKERKVVERLHQHLSESVKSAQHYFKHFKLSIGPKDESRASEKFTELVRRHYDGLLQGPFNKQARDEAGLGEPYYMPLTHRGPITFSEEETSKALAEWTAGSEALCSDEASLPFIVERVTNPKFPADLLRTVVKFL